MIFGSQVLQEHLEHSSMVGGQESLVDLLHKQLGPNETVYDLVHTHHQEE
jgi:hypothetical protein